MRKEHKPLVLTYWNARGVENKETNIKKKLNEIEAAFCGVSETWTYKADKSLSDRIWKWTTGPEGRPNNRGEGPARGLGALTDRRQITASRLDMGKYTQWDRIETTGAKPLVVGTGYFPQAQDTAGHRAANNELLQFLNEFRLQGYDIVFGGDLNAHMGANGDPTPPDKAGDMLQETAEYADMIILNTVANLCTGGPSRREVRKDGIQESTVDYIMCSSALLPSVTAMSIDNEDQMGSDHRLLSVTLNLQPKTPPPTKTYERWRVENIPDRNTDLSWVRACSDSLHKWATRHATIIQQLNAADTNITPECVADILDWGFQRELDKVASDHLGTKTVRGRTTPSMDAAMRMASAHKKTCRKHMQKIEGDPHASDEQKRAARTAFITARKTLTKAEAHRKQLRELALFRQIEERQGDSKLFWNKFKHLRNSIHVNKAPPPVATDSTGKTVTDPAAVLRVWRDYYARLASEEAKLSDYHQAQGNNKSDYDEKYKQQVETKLAVLKLLRLHQPDMDSPITAKEVFAEIRKLRLGTAGGEGGVVSDILKTAADAVGSSKMRGNTGVVEALVLIFNYVFDNEVWPERWGKGVVIPLHKHDSRLDPGNYRPITLMSIIGKIFGAVINTRLQDFSEGNHSISDFQAGFRTKRSTIDQIFLLRETLAFRKERNYHTYATYVDARKAYDTAWRAYTYVRIHESGVNGKVWRQLMAMHENMTRKIRLPIGHTDPFDIDIGFAQGAVESPWCYANFINGLAEALQKAGLGVWIAGKQVPLLMYADDIIMLAATPLELQRMNAVATKYAHQHRFQYNGTKSAVMVFNATNEARARAKAHKWTLFGEDVKVVDEYTYLGTVTTNNEASWKKHTKRALEKAQARSSDLLFVCRRDRGLRPRTAVTLWQSLVRPILEYGAELWSRQITQTMAGEAEKIQTEFLRGVLGLHANGGGVSNDAIRAETGTEPLADRWAKLQLGFWRRLFVASDSRLLNVVAKFRHKEASANHHRYGTRGWMPTARELLLHHDMHDAWANTATAVKLPLPAWKEQCYAAVETTSDAARHQRMRSAEGSATREYTRIKNWERTERSHAFSSGEENRLGRRTPERYLDDRQHLKATRLKLLCRLGALPLMDRVGREASPKWPKHYRTCPMCKRGAVEDVTHFLTTCPAYETHRTRLYTQVGRALRASLVGDEVDFDNQNATTQARILLGKWLNDKLLEDRIDRHIKTYMIKAWNIRTPMTHKINRIMGRSDDVWAKPRETG